MMRAPDLYEILRGLRPGLDECISQMFVPLMYHIEDKVIRELLHLDVEVDSDNLLLAPPNDDIYWKYILPFIDMAQGRVDLYREGRALFQEAWKRLERQLFLGKGEIETVEKQDWTPPAPWV